MSSASILRLELRPSRTLAATLMGIHLAAAACLFLIVAGAPGALLALLAAGLGAATARDRALLRGPRAPRLLELHGDGRGSAGLASGRCVALADGQGRAGRHWVTLALQCTTRRSLLVTADMLDAESFRRLRLWALWGRVPAASSRRPA